MAAQNERARRDAAALAPRFPATLTKLSPVRIGVIVFDEDTTTEEAIGWLGLPALGVAVHVARMPLSLDLSEQGLDKTAAELEAAGGRLVPSAHLSAIAYSCTTGALELGLPRVMAALTRAREGLAHHANYGGCERVSSA